VVVSLAMLRWMPDLEKIKEIRVRALHQEIHDSIHRIDPSTYIGSDGVRCVEP